MSEAAGASGQLEPEDEARANFYALLARLFREAPDAALLRAIAGAPPLAPAVSVTADDNLAYELAGAWDELRAASERAGADATRDEYQALFIGVGRSEVSLYASHYLGPQSGRPLAEIRASLAELGLARRPAESEFEDHLALVFETMRMLIAGDSNRPPAAISEQRRFFDRHVVTWTLKCCTAIDRSSVAIYYRSVAQFANRFIKVEEASFAIV
jgi:TorA maturation chaperone TorD